MNISFQKMDIRTFPLFKRQCGMPPELLRSFPPAHFADDATRFPRRHETAIFGNFGMCHGPGCSETIKPYRVCKMSRSVFYCFQHLLCELPEGDVSKARTCVHAHNIHFHQVQTLLQTYRKRINASASESCTHLPTSRLKIVSSFRIRKREPQSKSDSLHPSNRPFLRLPSTQLHTAHAFLPLTEMLLGGSIRITVPTRRPVTSSGR